MNGESDRDRAFNDLAIAHGFGETKEEWKSIAIYGREWPYEISSAGRVRRSKPAMRQGGGRTYIGKILKQTTSHRGYNWVTLWKNGDKKSFYVHVLVANAFVGQLPEGLFINHKDKDKQNNAADNLEYITNA